MIPGPRNSGPISVTDIRLATNWLVLIAVDRYEDSAFLPPLKGAKRGAEALKETLFNSYGFGPPHTIERYDEEATDQRIFETLRDLSLKCNRSDSVILSFAGHGEGGGWYPYDARSFSDTMRGFHLQNWLKNLSAQHVLIVSDHPMAEEFTEQAAPGKSPDERSRECLFTGGLRKEGDGDETFGRCTANRYLAEELLALKDAGRICRTSDLARKHSGLTLRRFIGTGDRGGGYGFFPIERNPGGDLSADYEKLLTAKESFRNRRKEQKRLAQEKREHDSATLREKAEQSFSLLQKMSSHTSLEERITGWEEYLNQYRETGHQIPFVERTLEYLRNERYLELIRHKEQTATNQPQDRENESRESPLPPEKIIGKAEEQTAGERQRRGVLLVPVVGLASFIVVLTVALYWQMDGPGSTPDSAPQSEIPADQDALAGAIDPKGGVDPDQIMPGRRRVEVIGPAGEIDEDITRKEVQQALGRIAAVTGGQREKPSGSAQSAESQRTVQTAADDVEAVYTTKTINPMDFQPLLQDGRLVLLLAPELEIVFEDVPKEGGSFWMTRTEITRAQWAAIMGGAVRLGGEELPVTGLTPAQILEFNRRLSGYFGLPATLPTQEQWRAAARLGLDPAPGLENDWFAENSGGQLQPVKGRRANGYGLYGLFGNAAETLRGPEGQLLITSGSYQQTMERAASLSTIPYRTADDVGFRVVCELNVAETAALLR